MPLGATITTVQDGDFGTVGNSRSYILGVADDRLIGGSSFKWPRFTMSPVGSPTSGTFKIRINNSFETDVSQYYASTPVSIAQALTTWCEYYGVKAAFVPISQSGDASVDTLEFEIRSEDPSTDGITGDVISLSFIDYDLNSGASYSFNFTQWSSGTLPSQSGDIHLTTWWDDQESQITTIDFDLDSLPSLATIMAPFAFGDIYGYGSVSWSATLKFLDITIPGNCRLLLSNPSPANNVALWEYRPADYDDIATCEKQELSLTGGVTGGTFTLTVDGHTTDPIEWNATPDEVETAIQAINQAPAKRGAMVSVGGSGLPDGPMRIVFHGLDGDVPTITADTSGLTNFINSVSMDITARDLIDVVNVAPIAVTAQDLSAALATSPISITARNLTSVINAAPIVVTAEALLVPPVAANAITVTPQELISSIQTPRIVVTAQDLDRGDDVAAVSVRVQARQLSSVLSRSAVRVDAKSLPVRLPTPAGIVVTARPLQTVLQSVRIAKQVPGALTGRTPRTVSFGVFNADPAGSMGSLAIGPAGKMATLSIVKAGGTS